MIDSERISLPEKPDKKFNVKKIFGIDSELEVKGFKEKTKWVPEIDETYIFDRDTTLAIFSWFRT